METDAKPTPSFDPDKRPDLIEAHANMLARHFDSVQIICTRHDADGSNIYAGGRGNWFARAGSIREWLTREDEKSRKLVRDQE